MNLDEYAKEDMERSNELILKNFEKIEKDQNIDIFDDFLPEFNDLKGKNFTTLKCGGSIQVCEKYPSSNLGRLLGSGLYDNVIFPPDLHCHQYRFSKT